MTGIVTDLNIELGTLLYWSVKRDPALRVRANRHRLAMLDGLLGCFLCGGVLGFKYIGDASIIPLALLVTALAVMPAVVDWLRRAERERALDVPA